MALKIADIITGGLFLGLAVVAWQNRDRIVELLTVKEPTTTPRGDSVAPENIPKIETVEKRDIYPTKGKTWTSSSWRNGKKRTVKQRQRDPNDSKLFLPPVGRPEPIAVIDGSGVLTLTGNTPRLSVKGPWKGTEITFFTKGNIGEWLAIHGASDHHDEGGTKKNRWGGYALKIFRSGNNSGVQKEPIHGIYCRANPNSTVPYNIGSGWVGWKGIQKVEGSNVVLEGYVNENGNGTTWKKLFRETDNGNFKCGSAPFNRPQTQQGAIAWLRFDGNPNVQIKDFSIREI